MNVILKITFWIELACTRCALKKLTAAELLDIGVSREDALKEARRPFYDYD